MDFKKLFHWHSLEDRLAHYRKHQLHLWTDLVLIATVLLLTAVVASLYVFYKTKVVNIVDFNVNYNAAEMINGQQVKFSVNYKNTSKKITVHDAYVTIKFPAGLREISVNHPTYNYDSQTVFLGILEPQAEGSFDLSGLALSNIGEHEKFLFALNYTNKSGLAQQEFTTREFVIEKSIIEASLSTPQTVLVGSSFPAEIKLKNNSSEAFENLTVKLDFPEMFKLKDTEEIIIEKIEPGQEISKQIIGEITKKTSPEAVFNIQLKYKYQDSEIILSRAQSKSSLRISKFIISFVNTENNQNLNPGDQTELNIKLENGEDFDIKNLNAALEISGNYLDKQFMEKTYGDDFHDFTLDLGSQISGLKSGETKNISLKIAALPFLYVKDENIQPEELRMEIKSSFEAPDSDQRYLLSSNELIVPINSVLTLKSSAIFYTKEGDQIGIGSVPPRPGEYTAYWAILELANGVNKVRNVVVTADLPAETEYADIFNVTQGAPIRKSGDNQLEWYLPELSAYEGINSAAPQARIQIAVVPSDKQVGQILTLLKNIRVNAVDDRTGYKLSASAKDVTTAIFPEAEKNKVAK